MAYYEYHSIKPMNFDKGLSFIDYLKSKDFIRDFTPLESNQNSISSQHILDYKVCSNAEWQNRKEWLLNAINDKYGSEDEEFKKLSNDDPSYSTALVFINGDELTWMNKYVENNSPAVFLSLAMPDVIFKYEHHLECKLPINLYCKNGELVNRDGEKVEGYIYDVSTCSNILSPIANSSDYKIRVNLGDNYGWCTIFVPEKNLNARSESFIDVCFTKPEVVIYNRNGKSTIPLAELIERYTDTKKAYEEQFYLKEIKDLTVYSIPEERIINRFSKDNSYIYTVKVPLEDSSTGLAVVAYSSVWDDSVVFNDDGTLFDLHIGKAGIVRNAYEYSEEQGVIWNKELRIPNRRIYDSLISSQHETERGEIEEESMER